MKNIFKIFYYSIFGLLVSVSIMLLLSKLNFGKNFRFFIVESGSMEPNIHLGSIIAVKKQSEYKIGDVITVAKPADLKTTLTHRIVKTEKKDEQILYTTKGDANKSKDLEKRIHENVIGKVFLTVPALGFFVNFAKSKAGLIFLIVIPSLIIIYTEILNIRKELIKKAFMCSQDYIKTEKTKK